MTGWELLALTAGSWAMGGKSRILRLLCLGLFLVTLAGCGPVDRHIIVHSPERLLQSKNLAGDSGITRGDRRQTRDMVGDGLGRGRSRRGGQPPAHIG